MSDQLWKYVSHVPAPIKKPLGFKRKSEVADKQVLNLTGGLFPVKLIDPAKHHQNNIQHMQKWIRVPIIQRNQKIGPIYHWVQESQQKKLYHGEKFNVQTQTINFTQQQFNSIQNKPQNVNFKTAKNIFQLLQKFNLNFVVVHDRLEGVNFTIQQLKNIYFTTTRQIHNLRGQKDHILANYVFDKKYETNRKYELQKYLMRSKVDTERQKNLVAQIRRLQILLKKQQRQQINLKKALKLDEPPQQIIQLQKLHSTEQMRAEQIVFTRQQYLSKPLILPGKTNQRLQEVLSGMNIPDKIVATQQNVELYDKLRQKILLMFSVQRYIRKKQNQRRNLQEKRKKITMFDDDDKSKSNLKIGGQKPQKKVHLNKP